MNGDSRGHKMAPFGKKITLCIFVLIIFGALLVFHFGRKLQSLDQHHEVSNTKLERYDRHEVSNTELERNDRYNKAEAAVHEKIYGYKETIHKKTGRREVKCYEDHQVISHSKIDIQPLKLPFEKNKKLFGNDCKTCNVKIYPTSNLPLRSEKQKLVDQCVKDADKDYWKGRAFFTGKLGNIRHDIHTYLNRSSVIIDVGGNYGLDAQEFLKKYSPNTYVVLEPLTFLFLILKKSLLPFSSTNTVFYNFGLGKQDGMFFVNFEGGGKNTGDATSLFTGTQGGACALKVVNTTNFFIQLGVGCFEVDLLTINCEGCEFEVLEAILSTNLVRYFKNIQFATHIGLRRIQNAKSRYCTIQELLRKTHKPLYMYKFNWESWSRI